MHELVSDPSGHQYEEEVFQLVSRHRLFPMAKELVDFSAFKDRQKWDNAISRSARRAMLYTKTLIQFQNEYRRHNIQAIPFKGPVLAYSLYGDIGKRQFVDLDLLVRQDDLERCILIAEEMGFSLLYPKGDFSEIRWNYYFKWKNDLVLYHEEERVFVELHVGVYYHKLLPRQHDEIFFRDLVKESIGAISMDCLNRNNTFLYLAFHGGFHQYFRLFWLRDFAEALQKWDLDHRLILKNAKEIGIERLLGLSLVLAEEFFNTEIPPDYSSYLEKEAKTIGKLSGMCKERIVGKEELNLYGKFCRFQYNLSLRPGIAYKCSVVKGIFHHWYIRKVYGRAIIN